jgi:murein L,D-transpeptidase YafK
VSDARYNVGARLQHELAAQGLALGNRVYFRSFKKTRPGEEVGDVNANHNKGRLEVWVADSSGTYKLFKSYTVCSYSGTLGPKTRQGDMQTPEGFYSITRFNPESRYHLSLDVGYPNARDRAMGYTGGDVMVHGYCRSAGCLAMSDISETDHTQIEEIYLLALEARRKGQREIPVHMFPFPLTEAMIQRHAQYGHERFWRELKPAYDYFERNRRPPAVSVVGGRYQVLESEASLLDDVAYVNAALGAFGARGPERRDVRSEGWEQKLGPAIREAEGAATLPATGDAR